jgi:hypothetical protein
LSRKLDLALAALLAEPTVAAAASFVGVNERTLRGSMQLPNFRTAFKAARLQILEQAINRLTATTVKAVATLEG